MLLRCYLLHRPSSCTGAASNSARHSHRSTACNVGLVGSIVDALKATLADEAVHAATEDAVLEAVLRWAEHDEPARGGHLLELLDHVRLDRLSAECFKYALSLSVVTSRPAAVLKLSVGYAARTQATYTPSPSSQGGDDGQGAKRQRTA